ncbi:MAG: cysteine desulfurase [Chlamydiales bacterium]|nr:cysteine desulfurase [Chlamydiales bacterium]
MTIYLDNNATTPLDKEVIQAMLKEFELTPLNPSSFHQKGQLAKSMLLEARKIVASYLQTSHDQIIFTSSATEGLNWLLQHFTKAPCHIITSSIEHAAIDEFLKRMKPSSITYLEVNERGSIDPFHLRSHIRPDTKLIITSSVNNETGVRNDIEKIAQIAVQYNIPLVVDAVAALGKEPITFYSGISAMVFSAHKIHGPKGIGCICTGNHLSLSPLYVGGGQESNTRSGTENLAGIIGFSTAISLIEEKGASLFAYLEQLRCLFEITLKTLLPTIMINGDGEKTSNVSNVYFPSIDAETLLMSLDQAGICASHGSACSSGSLKPSRILLNMGYSYERAKSSIRFSFSRKNTKEEIFKACEMIAHIVEQLYLIER